MTKREQERVTRICAKAIVRSQLALERAIREAFFDLVDTAELDAELQKAREGSK